MADWTDLSSEFPYGDKLTSDNMQKLVANITAMTEGASGAPEIALAALADACIHGIVPAGTVIAYMGASAPSGYLECDGSTINRTTYADLFTAIADVYGVGDGSTTFEIPDLRGEFLRGYDNGAGIDPDAATRTDAGDGSTTGDNVGTKQGSVNKTHIHDVSGNNFIVTGAGTGYTNIGTGGTLVYYSAATLADGNANEARPTNVSVMYCIRT